MFNVLEHAPWSPGLRGLRVLDLFAGSGALGLEALSRGARSCVGLDIDEHAREAVTRNTLALNFADKLTVNRADATRLGPNLHATPFDLAFLDAPYGLGMSEPALAGLAQGGWLAPEAIIVVERGVGEAPLRVQGYEGLDTRDWGAARVHFLKLASTPPE
jgi:16S rRNA (guanine966-N2)-methyltransferase